MEYISLGSNCSITYQLIKLGLRKQAYPFDWVKINITQLIEILILDFNNFTETLESVKFSNFHPIIEHNTVKLNNKLSNELSSSIILTNKYKIKFAHELNNLYEIDEFKNKIEKRIGRFRELSGKNICFVRIELSPLNKSWYSNIIKLNDLLKKYSNNFKLILIICSDFDFDFPSNIIIFRFNKFEPDWMMNSIEWNNILL